MQGTWYKLKRILRRMNNEYEIIRIQLEYESIIRRLEDIIRMQKTTIRNLYVCCSIIFIAWIILLFK